MRTTTFSIFDYLPTSRAGIAEAPGGRDCSASACSPASALSALALLTWSVDDPSLNHATNAHDPQSARRPGRDRRRHRHADPGALLHRRARAARLLGLAAADRSAGSSARACKLGLWLIGSPRRRRWPRFSPRPEAGRCRQASAASSATRCSRFRAGCSPVRRGAWPPGRRVFAGRRDSGAHRRRRGRLRPSPDARRRAARRGQRRRAGRRAGALRRRGGGGRARLRPRLARRRHPRAALTAKARCAGCSAAAERPRAGTAPAALPQSTLAGPRAPWLTLRPDDDALTRPADYAPPRASGDPQRPAGSPASLARGAAARRHQAGPAHRQRSAAFAPRRADWSMPSLSMLAEPKKLGRLQDLRGRAGAERAPARRRARRFRRQGRDRQRAPRPGRHALRTRARARHQVLARDRPRRRHRPLDVGHLGPRRRRAGPQRHRHRAAEPAARDGLSARASGERGLREVEAPPRDRARQDDRRRAGHRRSRAHAASAGRRHHRLGQVGRDQHDDPVAALSPEARAMPAHHGRSEDARALGLRRHSPSADAGRHRSEEGGRRAQMGGARDGGPLQEDVEGRRAQHRRLQRARRRSERQGRDDRPAPCRPASTARPARRSTSRRRWSSRNCPISSSSSTRWPT